MRPIKLLFDKVGNTLNVWFDDPQKEHVSVEAAEDVILVKNSGGAGVAPARPVLEEQRKQRGTLTRIRAHPDRVIASGRQRYKISRPFDA